MALKFDTFFSVALANSWVSGKCVTVIYFKREKKMKKTLFNFMQICIYFQFTSEIKYNF